MTLRLAAIVAMSLLAMAETAPRVTGQAASAVDPKEMAAVERIRALIEERGKKTASAPSAAYTVTIPNTTVTYGMARVPAGEFLMGSAGAGGKPDEQPQHQVQLDAFWMQTHEVTWDAYLMFMFADQAKEREHPDALVDALSRPTAPHLEMSFGRGNNGFPAISMTQHAANKFAAVAEREDRRVLPPADRGRVGVRVPRGRHDRRSTPAQLGDYAWFAKNSAAARFCRWHLSHDRNEEAERLGAVRHARQRHGVDPGSVRAVHGRAGEKSVGRVHRSVSPCRPRRLVERRRTGCGVHRASAVRRVVEEAGSATAEEHLVHDRRAVARLPPRASRHAAER